MGFPKMLASAVRRSRLFSHVLSIVALMAAIVTAGAIAAAAVVPDRVRVDVPIVVDGEVWDVEEVGPYIVVAGNFTKVEVERNGQIINQAGLFAYERDTGRLNWDFRPALGLNNPGKVVEVRDLEVAADGRSIFFGGRFTTVDDGSDGKIRTRNRIAKIDVRSGRLDRNFARGGVSAKVWTMAEFDGWLYVGGLFTEVFDTDVGRPPREHRVRGLARFDAMTGAFDENFRWETADDLGQHQMTWGFFGRVLGPRNYGVVGLDIAGDRSLVVAHRGRVLENPRTGQRFARPGLAIFDLTNPNGPALSGFRALYPDAASPQQDFYFHGMCSVEAGLTIRDLEVSPDGTYFVVVHQGADTGYGCDTTVRWPVTYSPTRPTWVSRNFDSVFSVGIDDDAVYIGGHFRYLPSPSSPSAYPGEVYPLLGDFEPQTYEADAASPKFRNELLNPGFVVRTNQLGALDPATGKAIPSWDPGTDAFKGVLALTVTDRGLLIGHDNRIVAGERTGRHAFFDTSPAAGKVPCNVSADGRSIDVTWQSTAGVSAWRIARDGQFIRETGPGTRSFTDTDVGFGGSYTYELRYRIDGISFRVDCGIAETGSIATACTAAERQFNERPAVLLSFNSPEADIARWSISVDGTFLLTTGDPRGLFLHAGREPGAEYTYTVRALSDGNVAGETTCTIRMRPPDLACSATARGSVIQLTMNTSGFGRVRVERDGTWQVTLDGGTSTWEQAPAAGTYEYEIVGIVDGARTRQSCGTVTTQLAMTACSVSLNDDQVTLTVDDANLFARLAIRRDDIYIGSINDGSTFTDRIPVGSYTYTLRASRNGITQTVSCGTIDRDVPSANCRTEINNDGTVIIRWDPIPNVRSWNIRSDGRWLQTISRTVLELTIEEPVKDSDYTIRFKFEGTRIDQPCHT